MSCTFTCDHPPKNWPPNLSIHIFERANEEMGCHDVSRQRNHADRYQTCRVLLHFILDIFFSFVRQVYLKFALTLTYFTVALQGDHTNFNQGILVVAIIKYSYIRILHSVDVQSNPFKLHA